VPVIIQVVHLPDDIVSQPESLEHLVQRHKTAGYCSGYHHLVLPETSVMLARFYFTFYFISIIP